MARFLMVAAFTAAFVIPSALAETNQVCIGGNIEQLSSTQLQACRVKAQQVRAAAQKAGTSNWHFVVVCDESGWADYAAFASQPAEKLKLASLDTNVDMQTTFVRASSLTDAQSVAEMASAFRRIGAETAPDVQVAVLR